MPIPLTLPPTGEWFVRILEARDRFLFGIYRRHMKTIAYLGQLDALLAARVTTRDWNKIRSVV